MKNLLFILLFLPLLAEGQLQSVVAQYPIDEPSKQNLNDWLRGRWKFEEDTNRNNFYEVIREAPYLLDRYHVKFWDRGGTNPTWESNIHFSKIGNAWFINVPYFFGERPAHHGYIFLKILETNHDHTKMVAAVVHDKTLWPLNQAGVRQRIIKNVDNPAYYFDTVHFYKAAQ